MHRDWSRYDVLAVLRDGGSVRIRAIRPDDRDRVDALFDRMSAESLYMRFFGPRRRLSRSEIDRFTAVDFRSEAALVATLTAGEDERVIGIARYSTLRESPGGSESAPGAGEEVPRRAEIAFLVEDAHQGRGIGTLLMEHLAPIARWNGITRFEAEVLGENNRMLELFAKSGFAIERSYESGIIHVSFPTEETAELEEASLEREIQARAMSLRSFLQPRSVAVVGASRKSETIGGMLMANLKRGAFKGKIVPVNPKTDTIEGLRAYPNLAAIGSAIDLAVVAVPAQSVEDVLAECARCGVRGAVVISAGFGETGPEGRRTEKRLVQLARGSGMRMVGPNCLGVLNTDPAVSLNATFSRTQPTPGNIGMSSQSGALGIAILDYLRQLGLGVSTFVSMGNKADVSGNDLLCFWSQDPRTKVIVLYLESFGNPRKFARIAPEVARQKPIIAVKSGRSTAGNRAASSHSAALASLDVAVEALFEQAGVIRTDTLERLFDVAALLATQPVPPGRRVGVVTNAGGPGILLADACEAHGLQLPELESQTVARLREFLPPQAGLSNPVDMIASASPEQYERALEAVGADARIDSIVAIYIPVLDTSADEVARALRSSREKIQPQKPLLSVFLSSRGAPDLLSTGSGGRIPAYNFPENAALALAAAEKYARWRSRPRGEVLKLDSFAVATVRAVIDRVLDGSAESVWIETGDLALILKAARIEFAASIRASPQEAPVAASSIDFPLVAKAIAPGLVHKSDVGGIILGLRSAEQVERAVKTLAERLQAAGLPLEAVLLQREVAGGIETLVGVTADPTFGPLIVCGMGGVLVELMKDVAFGLPPVSDTDASEMLGKLRSQRILEGYRGAAPGDRKALITLIQRISALVEAIPELIEMDLNPVKVLEPGRGVIAVDGRMRVAPI